MRHKLHFDHIDQFTRSAMFSIGGATYKVRVVQREYPREAFEIFLVGDDGSPTIIHRQEECANRAALNRRLDEVLDWEKDYTGMNEIEP